MPSRTVIAPSNVNFSAFEIRLGQWRTIDCEHKTGALDRRAEVACEVGRQGGQIDRLVDHSGAAGLDPCERQQCVDELEQTQGIAL